MDALRIRDATPADYATYQRLFPELGTDDPIPSLETFSANFAPTMLIAEQAGEALGYACYRLMAGSAHVSHLVTASAARRRGIGRALMAATIARTKHLGATALQLNVKPSNTPAIALYESLGLRTEKRVWALWMEWSAVLAQPAPFASEARTPEPAEDATWEARLAMPPGLLTTSRKLSSRVFRVLGDDALIGFDVDFPGAFPFHAPNAARAFALLHAVRREAKPEKDRIAVLIEANEALKDAFVAAGAHLRFELLRLRGPI